MSSKTIREGKSVTVSVPVTNTGAVAGSEIIQIYVHDCEASVDRPYKELKGWDKVFLQPGETKVVKVELGPDAFKFYDVQTMNWKAEPGEFEILAGAASNDIRTTAPLTLK